MELRAFIAEAGIVLTTVCIFWVIVTTAQQMSAELEQELLEHQRQQALKRLRGEDLNDPKD